MPDELKKRRKQWENSTLKKVFGLTNGTLRYHLKYLTDREKIKSRLEHGKRRYYPVRQVLFDSQKLSIPSGVHQLNKSQELLINTIRRNPGITQKDLITKTRLKRITVTYNLNKLMHYGIVRKTQSGKNVCYDYITDVQLRDEILKRLVIKLLKHEIDEDTFLAIKDKLDQTHGRR